MDYPATIWPGLVGGEREGPGLPQTEPESEKLAFVLSGGGSLGSFQVGCIEALMLHGIFPDLIVGTSVGALNAAWLAQNPTLEGVSKLKEIWLSQGAHGPFRESRIRVFLRLLLGRKYLYANHSLRNLVCQYVGETTFEELPIATEFFQK